MAGEPGFCSTLHFYSYPKGAHGHAQVVCQEALAVKQVPVVKEVLTILHDKVTASKASIKPGEEACILRNLIQVTAGEPSRCFA